MYKGFGIWWMIAIFAGMAFIIEEDFRKFVLGIVGIVIGLAILWFGAILIWNHFWVFVGIVVAFIVIGAMIESTVRRVVNERRWNDDRS